MHVLYPKGGHLRPDIHASNQTATQLCGTANFSLLLASSTSRSRHSISITQSHTAFTFTWHHNIDKALDIASRVHYQHTIEAAPFGHQEEQVKCFMMI